MLLRRSQEDSRFCDHCCSHFPFPIYHHPGKQHTPVYHSLFSRQFSVRKHNIMTNVVKVSPVDHSTADEMKWLTTSGLTVVVVGASGDLAKKKTYPSLLDLYDGALLFYGALENSMFWFECLYGLHCETCCASLNSQLCTIHIRHTAYNR